MLQQFSVSLSLGLMDDQNVDVDIDTLLTAQLRLLQNHMHRAKPTPQQTHTTHIPTTTTTHPLRARIDALAQSNKRLAEQCAALRTSATHRQPYAPPSQSTAAPTAADSAPLEQMLKQSLSMHAELMGMLRDEALESQHVRAQQEEDAQRWRMDLEAAAEEEELRGDAYAAFGSTTVGGHQPPPYEYPVPDEYRRPAPAQRARTPLAPGASAATASATAAPAPSALAAAPRANGKEEEELLADLKAALDSVSDTELEQPVLAAPRSQRDGEGRPARMRPGSAGARDADDYVPTGKVTTLATAAFAIIFAQKVQKFLNPILTAEEVSRALEVEEDFTMPMLRRAIRPVVLSIVRDATLSLDFAGLVVRKGGLFSKSISAESNLELQASKLKVRAAAIIDILREELDNPEASLVAFIRFICTRRVMWPEGLLLPNVAKLLVASATAPGVASPAGDVTRFIGLSLVLVRKVVQGLLMRPRESMLASNASAVAQANLRMVAALLFCVFELAVAQPPEGALLDALPALLTSDATVSKALAPELERLQKNGLTSQKLREWLPWAVNELVGIADRLASKALAREAATLGDVGKRDNDEADGT